MCGVGNPVPSGGPDLSETRAYSDSVGRLRVLGTCSERRLLERNSGFGPVRGSKSEPDHINLKSFVKCSRSVTSLTNNSHSE